MSAAVERPAHRQVKMTDGFWAGQLDKIHRVTVWDVLNKFENDHEEGIMKNYEWVIEGKSGSHVGPPWYDGLICRNYFSGPGEGSGWLHQYLYHLDLSG